MPNIYDIEGNILYDDSNSLDGLEDIIPNRLLVWHDEFIGPGLDESKWMNVYSMSYVKDTRLATTVNNGLQFIAIRDNRKNGNIDISSPELFTRGKFEFKYGRIEAKIKFPSKSPYHSTFWTLGACFDRMSIEEGVTYDETRGVLFPSCGEIDIAEFDNGSVGARTHYSSVGFDSSEGNTQGGNIEPLTSTPTQWHIYAAEWTETSVTFFVDGVQKSTWNTSNSLRNGWNPFNHPHFIILNCISALTGTPSWDICETDVKWIRVYAPEGVTEYIKETAVSISEFVEIDIGDRKWLEPIFTPITPSDMTLTWISHNDDIVTCHGGMLIGVSAGQTYVQCITKHGCKAYCKVTVNGN